MDNNDVVLFDPEDMFSPVLITSKMARGRVFSGFSEIRFRQGSIECDYVMSNGTLNTKGTFQIQYQSGDEVYNMVDSVTKALGDAFKKFERITTNDKERIK